MAQHSAADNLKGEILAMVQEIETQIAAAQRVVEASTGIGARVFALHALDQDVFISGGLLTNFVSADMNTVLEHLRLSRDRLKDFAGRL